MTVNDITTSETGYTITRELDAPIGAVWATWTTRDHFARWFHADPETLHLDVRSGGTWRCTVRLPDGTEQELSGGYAAVEPPTRLVETMDTPDGQAEMDIRLSDLGGRTRITVSQECRTAEERDMARQGSAYLVDTLADYVASL